MESIASELKAQRENRKISLAQIAADTRISMRHLQSLEEGRFNDLPGGMYNRAFIRAYCESLELDQGEILQRYEAEVLPHPDKPLKSKTKSHIPSSTRIHPVAIWSLVFVISATGIFLSRKWIAAVFSPYFSGTSATAVSDVPPKQPVSPPAPETKVSIPAPPAEVPISTEAGSPAGTTAQEASAAGGSSAAASSPAPLLPAAPAATASAHALRLEISGKEKSWVSVTRDGSPIFSKVMEPGEVQSFDADEKLYIIVGNAGGISLKINGKVAKPLGKSGEVIKLLINASTLPNLLDRSAG